MASFINPFISVHVPMLWAREIAEFGRTVQYWPGGDQTQAAPVTLIWLEGVETEEVSPGRYSHANVQNSTLPAGPLKGDVLQKDDGSLFEVVRVKAFAYYFSTLVLQER